MRSEEEIQQLNEDLENMKERIPYLENENSELS